jgi:hypothetical protein
VFRNTIRENLKRACFIFQCKLYAGRVVLTDSLSFIASLL